MHRRRVERWQLPQLVDLLRAIPPARVAQMQVGL